jgi:hypothetical protein
MGRVKARSNSLGQRGWIALLGVLAIAIQCFVVQIHVHHWSQSLSPQAQVRALSVSQSTVDGHQDSKPAPISPHRHGGSGNCYICQSALAGAAVLSSVRALNVIHANVVANVVAITRDAPTTASPSHIWRSRGPPVQL